MAKFGIGSSVYSVSIDDRDAAGNAEGARASGKQGVKVEFMGRIKPRRGFRAPKTFYR